MSQLHDENADNADFEFTVFTPSAADDFNPAPTLPQLTNRIRRNTRTLRNRLHSIAEDARFVAGIAAAYSLPLVPNARAGDWYVPPWVRAGGVYFKSTDGHTNEWGFSLRRLNLQLLELCQTHQGAVIVDSTRRGKRFPDALSKTVPIWIAVINSMLFPQLFPEPVLYTTPLAVTPHEAAAIRSRLPRFLQEFLALGVVLPALEKPLRPLFVTPTSPLPVEPPVFEEFTPLVLVTASRVVGGLGTEGEYIQGAGDDHELWAARLTPEVFWAHEAEILGAVDEDAVEDAVTRAVKEGAGEKKGAVDLVVPTRNVFVAAKADAAGAETRGRVVVNCSETQSPGCLHVPIPSGKRGNKAFRTFVPGLLEDLADALRAGGDVVFVCDSGNDVAPAVALAVLCACFNNQGQYLPEGQSEHIDKMFIKQRLAWITAARPTINPARGLLSAVNSVLMPN